MSSVIDRFVCINSDWTYERQLEKIPVMVTLILLASVYPDQTLYVSSVDNVKAVKTVIRQTVLSHCCPHEIRHISKNTIKLCSENHLQ